MPFSERNVGVVSIFFRVALCYDARLERAGVTDQNPNQPRRLADPNKVSTAARKGTATGIHSFIRTRSYDSSRLSSFLQRQHHPSKHQHPRILSALGRIALPRPYLTRPILSETTRIMSLAINTNRPLVSSPLASSISPSRQPARPIPIRNPLFPASRPLRPFPSIAGVNGSSRANTKKPVKIIEPPKGYSGGCFVLNLTQAELSRRD
jgi:hypothetical protein